MKIHYIISAFLTTGSLLTGVASIHAEVEVIPNLIPLNPVPTAPLVEPEKIEVNIVRSVPAVNHRVYKDSHFSMSRAEGVHMRAKEFIMDDTQRFVDQTPFENFSIQVGELSGKGTIKASNIKIVADVFSFKGLLSYTENCTIVTPTPVDKSQFLIDDVNNQPVFIVDPKLEKYDGINFIHFDKNYRMTMLPKGK